MQMIDNWKQGLKFASVWFTAVGSALLAATVAFPELWASLPPELLALMPAHWVQKIGIAVVVCSMVARFVKQKSVNPAKQKGVKVQFEPEANRSPVQSLAQKSYPQGQLPVLSVDDNSEAVTASWQRSLWEAKTGEKLHIPNALDCQCSICQKESFHD